jgi:hypothetical protein
MVLSPLQLADVFQTPLGLLALAALVPLVLAYLVRPEPRHVPLPTIRFLADETSGGESTAAVERLRRNLLLFVQALAILLLALALAGPYVSVARTETVQETAVVLDTSASMQTAADGGTRFGAARERARDAVASTTTVVTTAASSRVRLLEGSATEARSLLAGVEPTDSDGDLAGAIRQATAVAPSDVRVVVVSDFAGTAWRSAVEAARARGYEVRLEQVGGRVDNAGIVGVSYGRTELTATVRNYGDESVTRTLRLGDRSRALDLAPGDVATATFPVPPGNERLRLAGEDAFPVDDTVYVAGPDRATVDVLLVTNDENRYLGTALGVLEEVNVTVVNPPAAVAADYDVVVFSNVAPDRVLNGTLSAARETARDGGGVVVQSQRDVGEVGYGDLLLLEPGERRTGPSVSASTTDLTEGIAFTPPREYVGGTLRSGQAAVTADGAPLVATGRLGEGRLVYYGYIEDASSFKFNYQYPVFWKRVVYHAAGRAALTDTNRRTGETVRLATVRSVEGPNGTTRTDALALTRTGFYRVDDRRYAASLLDPEESNVTVTALSDRGAAVGEQLEREAMVPLRLSPFVALLAVLIVLGELLVLRRRGDL